ncbi:hypothetical protein N7462_011472 [Penicillium macrosclerotiorum]|uniref:uncharacterized protein n=1 Tax=Penicillium macrosclerotiorum TaxID=303699 RepID=UPI0025488061|nr:uncharacterized protein N7462_011472 [Penicillium macrosclerotiorum]KAJ5664659.1 hypothetical protein N7462_011472 [Penicillium macrosclerotiorum]
MSILKVWQWIVKQSLWAAQTLWAVFGFAISFILLNCAVSAAPIAIIWTRDLDSGIQGAVSIAIMIIVIAFVGVPFWYRSEPTFRSALPKIILSGISSTLSPRWARIKLFFLITSAISILVPLVLIWTHPLAAGIKSALTAGIVMIESLVLVTIILWWRLS